MDCRLFGLTPPGERSLPEIPLDEIDLLVIENVGNLVCPAEFRVGEDARVIEDHEFIAAQQVGKFTEVPVVPRAGDFIEEQHARSVARREWVLRDALRRQVEI